MAAIRSNRHGETGLELEDVAPQLVSRAAAAPETRETGLGHDIEEGLELKQGFLGTLPGSDSSYVLQTKWCTLRFPRITFIENWLQGVVFCSYIGLFLCYTAWVHVTQSIQYPPTMMIMSVLFTKITVSLVAYFILDGSPAQLWSVLVANRMSLLLYILPAFAYATTDSLAVFALRRLDPPSFAILYNIRVVFMLLLFQRFMRIPLRRAHWCAMGLVIASCIIKELPHVWAATHKSVEAVEGVEDVIDVAVAALPSLTTTLPGDTSQSSSFSRLWTVLTVVVMAQLAAFAAVYSEKLLKEQNLSLNIQNLAMYSFAVLATCFYTIILPALRGEANILIDIGSGETWKTIWTYPVVVAVALSAAYGLVTSFFIKSLNNVVREIACAVHILGTIPINMIFFGYAVRFTDLIAVCGVILGVSIYNGNPLKNRS